MMLAFHPGNIVWMKCCVIERFRLGWDISKGLSAQ